MPDTEYQRVADALPFRLEEETLGNMSFGFLAWATPGGDIIPPWWSSLRDAFLRQFYYESDPIKIAVGTFVSKTVNVPFAVTPRDRAVKRHARQAEELHQNLYENSGIFQGFPATLEQMTQDFLTQDNGCFAMVIGDGPINRPISGPALGLLALDSQFCTRTGNPQFPVIYDHSDGNRYVLHYTRIIYMAHLPTVRRDYYGIGMCPESCCLDSARELKDITVESQESFGSRPMRKALYVKKGATLEQLQSAVALAEQKMDSAGLTRFAKTLLMAPKAAVGELELDTLDLAGAPKNFNRHEVSIFDMAFLAASFGLDLIDLAISFANRTTGASAEVSDRKGWGKGVARYVNSLVRQLNSKFLPPHLQASAETVDDEQDEKRASIWSMRSEARTRDLTAGVTNVRVERENMVRQGEITEEQFEDLELMDGRLPNGLDVFALFRSDDPVISPLLELGVENPTIARENDATMIMPTIEEQIAECWEQIDKAYTSGIARRVRRALACLEKLRAMYQTEIDTLMAMEQQAVPPSTDTQELDPQAQAVEGGDEQIVNDTARMEGAQTV